MKNKLHNPVAINNLFFLKERSSIKLDFKIKNLLFVLLIGFLFLSANKSYAQLVEDFNSGVPNTWTIIDNGVGTTNWQSTTDGYLGTSGVSVNPSADNIGDQNTAEYFLVTPQVTVPENGEIQFYTKQASAIDNGAAYEIRISTAAQPDINGFNIVIQSYTEANLNNGSPTNYEKKVVELPSSIPAGFNIYIAFVAVNTQNGTTPTGDEWFVDTISVVEGCEDILEEDVTIDAITVNGAEVSWSHPTATNFEIQILPSGGTPAESGIPVTGNTYSLSSLDEDTEFDVYLAAICDNDTQSDFTGPYSFKTLKLGLSCDAPIEIPDISTTPYVLADNLDAWANPDVVYSTQGANCISGSSTANYLNGNKIFLSYTPTEDGLLTLTQTTFTGTGGENDNCYNDSSSLFVYESCSDVGVNCMAGTITTDPFDPKTISNLLVQQGQTYIIVVSSQLSTTAGICFELEISSPTCAPPGDIVYNSLTENSVSLSWDNNGGFSDSWEYVIVPTNSGEPTGSGTATASNVNNVINTGLSPDTTYDVYVRSVCNGTPGIWSNPTTFTTQCTVFDTPYSTDFETATNQNPEACWTTIDANNDGTQWSFIGGYATVVTSASQYENYDFYISPQINFNDGVQKRVRYKHRATQGVSTYAVKLSTTGVGVDDFTTVLTTETINNTNFQEIIVDIPETITGIVNIAWIVEPNTTESALRVAIDDVFIEDKPTCPDPTDPLVFNITTNSAWLVWTAGDSETQWEVAIQDLDSGIPTTSGVLTSSNFPYMATGLTPGNRYEYYVRAYCAEDDQSEWVGPVPFTTLCTSYDTPFYESFNDEDPDTQKFCWSVNDNNNDDATWSINETEAILQTSVVSPPSSFDDYLISPAINIDGTKELKYKYRAQFSFFTGDPRYGLEVLMSTTNTNPSSFSVIAPFEVITNSEYIEKSVIIEGNGTIYIAFRVPPEFSGNFSVLNIEDVSITDAPACPNPANLIVETTTTNGATFSWTQGYQETAWNVVVQPAGSGVPTATGEEVTQTNYTTTSLNPDTEYEVYVMANCGADGSEWVGPVAFRTLCTAFTSPFVETFNYDSTSEDCWQVINNNDDGETWELDSASFPFEGDQAAAIFTGSNGQNEDWLISPTITITENQRLRYYYRVNDEFFTEDLEVLLSTNGTGLDQFTTVLYDSDDDPVLINNEEYKVKIINFPAGITGDINIAFHVPYFASTTSYRGQTLVIDNVNIEDVPECPEPTNVFLNNITDTAFQVNWDANGSETAWEISVQPTGTPAPTGSTEPEYLFETTTNPFTITGLTASTMYDVYVRAVCDGDEGAWTGPTEVITKCSFDNLCQYTFVLTSDSSSPTLDITQNNQVTQSLPFTGQAGEEFPVFLCSGVEFSLYFDTIGWSTPQYANFQFDILNDQGETVYSSPTGLIPRTTVYTGMVSCGVIDCPQPTDLTISDQSVFSWTPGGSETQWEVAVQPLQNGTIPQSGTIVSTNSYTPNAADFSDINATTYEYFVRAICGTDDESYWSGPFEFVRNDDVSNAVTLPINNDGVCNVSSTNVSFINATASSETMSCEGVNNGDVWFQFTAASEIHSIEINNFNGGLRDSNGYPLYPEIVMTLYKDNAGTLEELACSYDNVIMAMYASELVVGENYKVRLTLNTTYISEYLFSVCVKTPEDLCAVDIVNGGFEEPALEGLSGTNTIISLNTVPGWRSNLESSNNIFYWESLNAPGFEPYEGGQCVQVLSEQGTTIDPNDPNIKGLYRDLDTSEITLLEYSFAHLARFDGNTIQLFAGPVGGPYTMIQENLGTTLAWTVIADTYQVPAGQNQTRFIFRASDGDDIGNVLDAVSILPNSEIITEPFEVDCTNPTALLEANGIGQWIAGDENPGEVTITNDNPGEATVTDFFNPGTYTFIWQTGSCSYNIEVSYNGISEMPTVESPIEYCLNETAEALTATTTNDYTLIWYTEAVGGTGSIIAPTPNTTAVGDTIYYVANQDENGCEGPRAELIVTINEAIVPELTFSYLETCILDTDNPTAILVDDFVAGGTFSSLTLTVDATTGEIDINSATEGVHDVVYTYNGDTDTCTLADSYTTTITFSQAIPAVTTFDYGATSFCELENTTVTPNLVNGFTTGGTFSSTTLTVDETTGALDLSSATIGNHDITYTYVANESACEEDGDFTVNIEITEAIATITDFTYAENTYCSDATPVLPILATDFTTGGIFSAEPGLTIDAVTGEINVATSTVGDYIVTYQIAEDIATCTQGNSSTFAISIQEIITPELSFSYADTCELVADSVMPLLNDNFVLGGTFSSTTLTVDPTTGAIDVTSATAGTHNITYTFGGDTDMCILSGSYTATINVTQAVSAVVTFDYGATSFCELNATTVLPNLATGFTIGGTFSSSTLTVDAVTGELDLTDASSGTHEVVYTFGGDVTACLADASFVLTIEIIEKTVPNTSFTYVDDVYCATSANVLPELAADFTTGGTFSAETGLTINSTTGEVIVSSSAIGNYTISYEVSEDLETCTEASVSTFNITILDTIEASIDGACNNEEYWLTVSPINGSYSPDEVTYTWMDANGNVVGENSELFNVTAYADQNPNITVPTQFTVYIDFGNCQTTASFTTERFACRNIPRGISPDGNGKNDTFDLTGFGVTNMIIFNRYGKEVYSFSGNYSNQWNGKSNKGKELPDGTYFYRIQKEDGSAVTGWVYINRAH